MLPGTIATRAEVQATGPTPAAGRLADVSAAVTASLPAAPAVGVDWFSGNADLPHVPLRPHAPWWPSAGQAAHGATGGVHAEQGRPGGAEVTPPTAEPEATEAPSAITAPAPEEGGVISGDAVGAESGERWSGAGDPAAAPDQGQTTAGPSRPQDTLPPAFDAGYERGRSTPPHSGPWPREPTTEGMPTTASRPRPTRTAAHR